MRFTSIIGGFKVNSPYLSGSGVSDEIFNVVTFPLSGVAHKGAVGIPVCLYQFDYSKKIWCPMKWAT
ncbi:MAG: hypothetical protein IMZ59_02145 [Actinobacteria bacterium]|nr:hypothetical protein [Actinomycetota bacterium]